jgi:hypothetical protein
MTASAPFSNHPAWEFCTFEGAEMSTLLMGLKTTFQEKLQWLEEAETLSLQFQAAREKARRASREGVVPDSSPLQSGGGS